MDKDQLNQVIEQCRALIEDRYPPGRGAGAAAMLLADGTVLVGTAPGVINPAVKVCHETEPYCAAHRLGQKVLASLCLYRRDDGSIMVLAPCGVCQERLATHGPTVLVGVPVPGSDLVRWLPLSELMPHYWAPAFEDKAPEWSRAVEV